MNLWKIARLYNNTMSETKCCIHIMDKDFEVQSDKMVDIFLPEHNVIIKRTLFGDNVTLFNNINIYDAEIGDNTVVRSFVEIRKGVKIGRNCVIESFSALVEGVTVGDNVYIGPGSYVTNDMVPKSCDELGEQIEEYDILKTHIPDGTVISGGVLIRGGVKIGRGVYIGPGAIVVKDIPDFSICMNIENIKKEELNESNTGSRETIRD